MTTINNIQDLIQLLRDQPHWADELRGILLSEELRDLPAAVRDLAQAVRDSADRTSQRLAALESVAEVLPERTQAVERKVDGLQTAVDALGTKVDGLDTKVDALGTKVDALGTKVDALGTKVDTLGTKVDGLQTQVDGLDTKIDGLGTKVDGLQTQVDGLDTKVDGLQIRVEGLDTTTDTLTGHMNHLRGAEYERRAENRALHRTQTQMGFLQPRIVMGPRSGLQPVFSSALARARAAAAREQRPLPELTEQNNFLHADIIVADMGDPDTRERRNPPVAYALFEASITADGDDVRRAADRARTLAQTMGVPVTPRGHSRQRARANPPGGRHCGRAGIPSARPLIQQ